MGRTKGVKSAAAKGGAATEADEPSEQELVPQSSCGL